MKQVLYVLLALFLFSQAGAISQSGLLFLSFEPSSVNNALGCNPVAAANIWSRSALTAYSNPALPALQNGIIYSFTRYKWLPEAGMGKMYYNAAFLTASHLGIGVLLPAPNGNLGKFGINMDFGEQVAMDEQGNFLGTFEAYDDALVGGLSVNPLETYRKLVPDYPPWLNFIDLAAGLNYAHLYSYQGPGTGNTEDEVEAGADIFNFGSVARLSYTLEELIKLEAVYGLVLFNFGRARVSYVDQSQSDPIYRHVNQAGAFSVSVPSSRILEGFLDPEYIFCEHLFSLRALTGTIDERFDDDKIPGGGIEVGLLDTFFTRFGRYEDKEGSITGNTFGLGFNLHYKNLAALMINYSKYPAGDLQDKGHKTVDFNLNFDLLGLMDRFSRK